MGDVDQAERLAGWLKELGPFPGHRLLVARDVDCPKQPFLNVGFDRVDEIIISDDVWKEWPTSANNVFRKIAKHIEYADKAPYWLWMEPDVVPLRSDVFDVLAGEYERAGRPFSGDRVAVANVPAHMSGVAIYPREMTRHAGEALICYNLAWDMACKEQTLPVMNVSRHILHAWKHPEFKNLAEFQKEIFEFKPECLLFHASKDGSLIEILRAERNKILPVPVLAEAETCSQEEDTTGEARESTPDYRSENIAAAISSDARGGQIREGREVAEPAGAVAPDAGPLPFYLSGGSDLAGSNPAPLNSHQPLCDILIKSYPADYELLKYCLRAIDKYARGFRQVILVVPEDKLAGLEFDALLNVPLKTVPIREAGDGYLFQQTVKARAHHVSDADYILHIDSDTFLTDHITPDTFIYYGLPIWFITPYDTMGANPAPWQGITESFMGSPVRFEFMRRFPFLLPRFLHEFAEKFCLDQHGVKLGDYILAQPNKHFSEFNALGAIAHKHFNDRFYWFDTSTHPEAEWPKLTALQTWSYAELTDEMRAKYEQLISGAELERPGEPATGLELTSHRTSAPKSRKKRRKRRKRKVTK